MTTLSIIRRVILLVFSCLAAAGLLAPMASAQEATPAITKQTIAGLDQAMEATKEGASDARQRLALRRVIRDAEQMLEAHKNDPGRFLILEFLFRAYQRLIALDDDAKHRQALLETCRELVKAPDDLADLRLEADLLLSQAEVAKQGANAEARSKALRPLVKRYVDTPAGAKVLRMAMLIALELGDSGLVNDLREMIAQRFAGDPEMISFQRDRLGGQVFAAPLVGNFKRSDGKSVRFPMDLLGRSSMLLFWSKDNDGLEYVKGIAAASLADRDKLAGRLEIFSVNLDNLPDAGESIIRGMNVNWQVLHLPGGREHPVYKAYVRMDPLNLRVSPVGQSALVMSGTTRKKVTDSNKPDYGRMFQSELSRGWTGVRYVMQLSSLIAGDFLVLDPEGGSIDPTRPPELKALAKGKEIKPLDRAATSVPEETLRAIQESFVMPPRRYRLNHQETMASYAKSVELCRKAIADHPAAPDLWLVRNRLMIALLGLWKTEANLDHLEAAVAAAKTALDAGYPNGCDLVARFCMARAALRDPSADPGEVIDRLVAGSGGESASGPALAVAALLALDVADRRRFEKLRETILKDHTEYPMMWIFTSFLLDRFHRYWLFQEPFTAGWSYGRREDDFLTRGDTEEARRMLKTELRTHDGKPLRIPEDLDSQWTMILFSPPAPWSGKRDDGLPPSPESTLHSFSEFAAARPAADVKVMLATLGGDAEKARAELLGGRSKVDCPVLSVPDGIDNPLANRLGILSEDSEINSLLVARDGRIAVVISGLGKQGGRGGGTLSTVICQQDEMAVSGTLQRGDVQAAKDLILTLAPPFDPDAVDARGRKTKPPTHHTAHLRARARVYMALKEWDKALADAEEVYTRQYGTDSGMSLRTPELDEAEQLRDSILKQRAQSKEP